MGKDLRDFGIVFRSVLGNKELTYGARTLYALLCTWRDKDTNVCFPGGELLTSNLGASRQQINDWFKELEKHKVLERQTRFNTLNGKKIRTIIIMDDNYEP